MKSRKLSLIALSLFLIGIQLVLINVGSGSPVEAELPPTPTEQVAMVRTFTLPDRYADMPRYDLPLSIDLQKYIWKLCQEHTLSFEFVLAVIQKESDFLVGAVGRTGDLGLMQLNPYNTMDWLSAKVGITDFDPFNGYHNATAGIWYLAHIRDYWEQFESCQQRTFALILLSYNRGIGGATKYVRNAGERAFKDDYVLKVTEFKYQFEGVGK